MNEHTDTPNLASVHKRVEEKLIVGMEAWRTIRRYQPCFRSWGVGLKPHISPCSSCDLRKAWSLHLHQHPRPAPLQLQGSHLWYIALADYSLFYYCSWSHYFPFRLFSLLSLLSPPILSILSQPPSTHCFVVFLFACNCLVPGPPDSSNTPLTWSYIAHHFCPTSLPIPSKALADMPYSLSR